MTHPTPTPATPDRRDLTDADYGEQVEFRAPITGTTEEVGLVLYPRVRAWQREYGDATELTLIVPSFDYVHGVPQVVALTYRDSDVPALLAALQSVASQAQASGSLASATA